MNLNNWWVNDIWKGYSNYLAKQCRWISQNGKENIKTEKIDGVTDILLE